MLMIKRLKRKIKRIRLKIIISKRIFLCKNVDTEKYTKCGYCKRTQNCYRKYLNKVKWIIQKGESKMPEKLEIIASMLEYIEILEKEIKYLKENNLNSIAEVKQKEIYKLTKCIDILKED